MKTVLIGLAALCAVTAFALPANACIACGPPPVTVDFHATTLYKKVSLVENGPRLGTAALVHLDTKAGGATVAGFGTDSPCDAYYVLDGVTCTVVGFPTDVYKPSTTGGDFLCVYHASLSIDLAATGGPHPDYHTELAYTAMACIPPL